MTSSTDPQLPSPPAFLVYPLALIAAILFYLLTAPALATWHQLHDIDPFTNTPFEKASRIYLHPLWWLDEYQWCHELMEPYHYWLAEKL